MRNSFKALVLVASLLFAATFAVAAPPQREQGGSMHLLPKKIADLQGKQWGLIVAYTAHLQPEKKQPILQTVEGIRTFFRKQDRAVQQNGLWIVVTNPGAYSEQEKALLEAVKVMCRKEQIPLFIARAAQLPGGWQRYDTLP